MRVQRPICWLVTLATIALATNGCMTRPYKSDLPKNVTIKAETRPAMSVKAYVYSVDNKCRAQYKGAEKLSKSETSVGVPANKQSYFVFIFKGFSLLGGTNTISQDILFTPRHGYQYIVTASYIDTMYQTTVKERSPRGGWREIQYASLDSCVPTR